MDMYSILNKLSSIASATQLNEGKKSKPDFLDLDKDGDKKEPMKKAAKEKQVDEAAKPDFLDVDKDGNKKETFKKAVKDKKVKEAVDTGEYDARKTQPSSKEKQDKVFANHKERVKSLSAKDDKKPDYSKAMYNMFGGNAKELTKNLTIKKKTNESDDHYADYRKGQIADRLARGIPPEEATKFDRNTLTKKGTFSKKADRYDPETGKLVKQNVGQTKQDLSRYGYKTNEENVAEVFANRGTGTSGTSKEDRRIAKLHQQKHMKKKQPPVQARRKQGVAEAASSTTATLDAVFNEHDFYRLEHIWPALEAGDKREALRQINHYLNRGKNRAWWGDLQALDIKIDPSDVENSKVVWSKPIQQDVAEARDEDDGEYGWDVPEKKRSAASTSRKIAGRAYGGSAQVDEPEDDEDSKKSSATGTKKRGRPAGSKRAIGAKGPTGKSKLLKKGAIKEQGVEEATYKSDEGADLVKLAKVIASCETPEQLEVAQRMANRFLKKHAFGGDFSRIKHDFGMISDVEKDIKNKAKSLRSEEPVAEKAPPGAKAERMVKHIKAGYAKDGKLTDKEKSIAYATAWKAKKAGKVEEEGVEEGSTGDYSAKKARAGKDIGKPGKQFAKIAKSAGEKYGSKERGEKVAGAVLKKLRGKKEESVEETTTAGSVAPVANAAPKKSKGGMQFGKGVYENKIAESFNNKLSNVLNEGMSITASQNEDGAQTLSINATDEDAMKLASLLKLAGMPQSAGYQGACPHCGQVECGCEGLEEGDYANSPEQQYSDTDTMVNKLSGGLNGKKSTGQTTTPVVNRDPRRGALGPIAEEIREETESRLWKLYQKYEGK